MRPITHAPPKTPATDMPTIWPLLSFSGVPVLVLVGVLDASVAVVDDDVCCVEVEEVELEVDVGLDR